MEGETPAGEGTKEEGAVAEKMEEDGGKGEKEKEAVVSKDEEEVKDEESVGGADGEDKEGEDQKEQVSLQDSVGIFC